MALGLALGRVPHEVFVAFDRQEPEWPVIQRLAGWPHPSGLLAVIALGLTDYQLGHGGAERYWQEAASLLDRPDLARQDNPVHLIDALVQRPVSARLAKIKVKRIQRLQQSALPAFARSRSLPEIGQRPGELWQVLANAMGQKANAKTIVFAMKLVDLFHCAATGQYAAFPAHGVLPIDLRVARVALSAGIVQVSNLTPTEAVSRSTDLLERHGAAAFLEAWQQVCRAAGTLSPFRIDSLVWQLADTIPADNAETGGSVGTRLEAAGCEPHLATCVADELTAALR